MARFRFAYQRITNIYCKSIDVWVLVSLHELHRIHWCLSAATTMLVLVLVLLWIWKVILWYLVMDTITIAIVQCRDLPSCYFKPLHFISQCLV